MKSFKHRFLASGILLVGMLALIHPVWSAFALSHPTPARTRSITTGSGTSEVDRQLKLDVTVAGIHAAVSLGAAAAEAGPSISIGDVSSSEGNSGLVAFSIPVTLSSTSTQTISVDYATENGTAIDTDAGNDSQDYVGGSGSLTFTPGDSSQLATVDVVGDFIEELDETFFVNLSSPVNASIQDAQGLGTILNDDLPAEISVTVTDSPDPVATGQDLTYHVVASNSGPGNAGNFSVELDLPTSVSWVSSDTSIGTCSGTAPVICQLGNPASGTDALVDVVVTPTAVGSITAQAVVSGSSTDPVFTNDFAWTSTLVTDAAGSNTSVSLSDSADPVIIGTSFVYTAVVANAGPGSASGVTVSLLLDPTTTYASLVKPTGTTCTQPAGGKTGTISCSFGTIASGSSKTLKVTARPTMTGAISATANSSSGGDSTPGNNSDSESTQINTNATGCTLIGTSRDDSLTGASGDDVICGLAGNDTINAGDGNDRLIGAGGNDVLSGSNGNDTIEGGSGSDLLYGQAGNDALKAKDGTSGNDSADGGGGTDTATFDSGDSVTNVP